MCVLSCPNNVHQHDSPSHLINIHHCYWDIMDCLHPTQCYFQHWVERYCDHLVNRLIFDMELPYKALDNIYT